MTEKKEFQEFLAKKKLRKTSQRSLVWQVLLDSPGHLTVEELRERLLENGARVGLSTVYRTLKVLLDSGMIRGSKIGNETRYERLVGEPNHIHFECNRCGTTEEFSSPQIEKRINSIIREHRFEAIYSRYAIFGICQNCTNNSDSQPDLTERQRSDTIMTRDAFELILAVERRGYAFYTSASKKTLDPAGRRMFEKLAVEEADHLERLQLERKALIEDHGWLRREPSRLPGSRKIADELFPQRRLLNLEVSEATTRLEALKIAIDLERESHKCFKNFANELEDSKGRKLFRAFSLEEKEHLTELLNEYERVKSENEKE